VAQSSKSREKPAMRNQRASGSTAENGDDWSDALERIVEDWQTQRPDIDASPMLVLARIARIEAMKRPFINSVFTRFELNSGLFDVLAALRRAGPPYRCTPTYLAESTMLTTGGITGRLDKLEAAGMVERERSDDDRRIAYAKLTPKGLEVVDVLVGEHLENERDLLASLSEERLQRLREDLAALEHSVYLATGGRMEGPGQ
jgi:DNA-binding MarR family transcriptional regulator